MHYLGSVMSKTKDNYHSLYCGGEGYLYGFVSDLTNTLDNKLLVFGK